MIRLICFAGILTATVSTAFAASDAGAKDAPAPNAMRHMVTAPEIDFVNLRDPFESYLALTKTRGISIPGASKLRINDRKHEFLEGFDLASLKLVAIFSMGGERVAMVQDATNKGYVVRRGNYLGKNNGHIEKITGDTVFLVEQAVDPAGGITDRQVSLTLNEINE
jgi:type IV pilus assembly protein PilP